MAFKHTVPTSKFAAHRQHHHLETRSPGTGETHEVPCTILEVYDAETVASSDVPNRVKNQLEKYPNLLYAKVRMYNGQIKYRPFMETQSTIYPNHGNAIVLQGRPARIRFYQNRVNQGKIVLVDDLGENPVPLPAAAKTHDIGMIV